MKTIKKLVAMFSLVAVSFATLGLSATNTVIAQQTTLTQGTSAGIVAPEILAKWEMYDPQFSGQLEEDLTTPGAQFDPTGAWNTNMYYMVCAVVTSQTEDQTPTPIGRVYANIFYPIDRAFHPEAPAPFNDKLNGGGGTIENPTDPRDYGRNGCGQQRGSENELFELSTDPTVGHQLFCDRIKNGDHYLPTSYVGTGTVAEAYNLLCGDNGKIMKNTAHVYCTPSNDKKLRWEDPAGDYRVRVVTQRAGVDQAYDYEDNYFTYLTQTAYEIDFRSVDYGTVLLSTEKIVSGDSGDPNDTTDPTGTFGTANKPTVRNVGNTRLNMGIVQDDMGFGQMADGSWNVSYRARVGSNNQDWKAYVPYQHKWLEDVLDLSQREEMDFGVTVTKFHCATFPDCALSRVGNMTLDARATAFRQCFQD